MKQIKLLSCATAVGLVAFGSSGAIVNAPWAPDGASATEKNLYEILGMPNNDHVQVGGVDGTQIDTDDLWSTAIGDHFTSLVIEQAGNFNFNSFGVYDPTVADPLNTVGAFLEIFPGSQGADPDVFKVLGLNGNTIMVGLNSITLGGTTFGFYLKKDNTGQIFYSEPSRNSPSGVDQLATFDINDTKYGKPPFNNNNTGWLLAWEDLPYNPSDKDFNDMLITLTAQPIPEPTTYIAGALLLLPFGFSTLRAIRRRAQK